MSTFFTADTHFGHDAIRKFCDRPWDTVKKMDDALIHNWNSVVQPRDVVYHLGDFAFRSAADVSTYRKRLNGKIHLIVGNHDGQTLRDSVDGFESVSDLREIKVEGRHITLCHYAMRTWPRSHHGSWQLYGHSHGTLEDDPNSRSIDVGVDCHDYMPIPFSRVKELMEEKTWEPLF